MGRAPFQVLVIPHREFGGLVEYCVLQRADADYWQWVAGGGEDDEHPIEAARRETHEECGVDRHAALIELQSLCYVPSHSFAARNLWEPDCHVIPEYCFALNVGQQSLSLSNEHLEMRWVSFAQAHEMLRWDSNKTALWELGCILSDSRRLAVLG